LEMQIHPVRSGTLPKESAVALAAPPVKDVALREPAQSATMPLTDSNAHLQFDVDLIPAPTRGKLQAKPLQELRLSRRDFALFGIGAGTVLFAFAVGRLLARLFPFKKTSASDDAESPPSK
jgi:hypothetical protein